MISLIMENITQSWKRVISFTDFNKVICYFQMFEDFLLMTKQHRRNSVMRASASHIFQHRASFMPELFKMRRSKTGYFFELGGKVCHTAVMHEIRYFRKIEFIIYE